jgi:hypothetical protein
MPNPIRFAYQTYESGTPYIISNHLTMILPLLGERAGVRASFLQPRHEALIDQEKKPPLGAFSPQWSNFLFLNDFQAMLFRSI